MPVLRTRGGVLHGYHLFCLASQLAAKNEVDAPTPSPATALCLSREEDRESSLKESFSNGRFAESSTSSKYIPPDVSSNKS